MEIELFSVKVEIFLCGGMTTNKSKLLGGFYNN